MRFSLFLIFTVFALSAISQNYCTPTFTTGCVENDIINNFSTTGGTKNITNNNSGCGTGAYTFYSNDTLEVAEGGSFSFSIQTGTPYQQGFRMYIDWNGDYDFDDANESPWNSGTWSLNAFTGTLTLPVGCLAGVKRIRVVCNYNSVPSNSCGVGSFGEVEDYVLVVTAPNYFNYKPENVQFSKGVYQDLGTLGTVISTANNDDANSAATNIGFNFNFNGTNFSQFVLNTNGFIRLGSTGYSANQFFASQTASSDNSPFKSSNILAVFNQDLKGDANTEYRVYTVGKTNERVCIIQYKNVTDRSTNRQFNRMNFQIKLYEGTNVIEFVYGDFIPSANSMIYEAFLVGITSGSSSNTITIAKAGNSGHFGAVASTGDYANSSVAFFAGNSPLSPQMPFGYKIRFNTGNIAISRPSGTVYKSTKTCTNPSSDFDLEVSGGTAPYAIVWSDTNYTFTRTLSSSNYQYTLSDALGNWVVANIPNYTTTSVSAFPHLTDFQTSTPDWRQAMDDDLDFIFASGVTPTATTGPSSGANSTTSYLYFESDSGTTGDYAAYESPCYDFTAVNYPAISFYYHMYGAGCDSLVLEADSGDGAWYKVWGIYGPVGNAWYYKTLKLIELGGKTGRLRFIAKKNNTNTGDIGLDEITVYSGPAPDFTAGFGNALNFNSNYFDMNNLVNFNSAFTVECWVKLSAYSASGSNIIYQTAGSGTAASVLHVSSAGAVTSKLGGTDFNFTYTLPVGEWHHLALSYNGSTVYAYVDGVLKNSATKTYPSNLASLRLGRETAATGYLLGDLDEFRLWTTYRTANEIASNYIKQLQGDETGLVTYYNFNSSSGTTAYDVSTNNNDAELYYFAGSEWVAGYSPIVWSSVNEVLPIGATLGYALGWDENDNTLSYAIATGNSGNYFDVDATTGEITLINPLDYEVDSLIILGVSVTESGGNLIDTGYYKFSVTDVYEVLFAGMGNALNFDGINDFVEVADTDSLNFADGDFTLEAWINVTSTANSETILSKGNGNGFSANDVFIFAVYNQKIALELGGYSTTEWKFSNTNVPANQWVHVAVSFDYSTSTATFYLNGVADGSQTYSVGPLYNIDTNPFYIGKQGYGCDCNYFNGKIDEVKVWSKSRTAAEIDSCRFTRVTGQESNLLAYYNFDETQTTELYDFSVPVYNGTLKNFSGSYWVSNNDTLEYSFLENPLTADTLFKLSYYTNSLNSVLISLQQSGLSNAFSISNSYVFAAKPKSINYETDSIIYLSYILVQQGFSPDTATLKLTLTDKVDLIIWNGNGDWYTDSIAGWSTQYTPNAEDSVIIQSGILVLDNDTAEIKILNIVGGALQLKNSADFYVNNKIYMLSPAEITVLSGSQLRLSGEVLINGLTRSRINGTTVFTGTLKY